MLHIILLLLKIIGILLLCVLGLILLLLLTMLFVPVRYRVAVEHGEELFLLKGRVNWLLHLVHVNITHIEGILHIKVRVFGFVIYDNLKKKEPKPPKIKAKKIKKTKVKGNKEKTIKVKANKVKSDRIKTDKTKMDNAKAGNIKAGNIKAGNIKAENIKADKARIDNAKTDETETDITEVVISEKEIQVSNNVISSEKYSNDTQKSSISEKVNTITKIEISGNTNAKVSQQEMEPETNKEKKSFFEKIWSRIRSITTKIKMFLESIKDKVKSIFTSIASFKNKWDLILNFLKDEMNKEGMHLTFASLKKLLKHVLPNKVDSKVIFGTGDPCSTGQALGVMSILYSFYGDKIRITPDFERNRLEGQHFIKGRIRLVTVLIIVVKLILDKRFKQLKNNFIILKEAL